MATRPVFIPEKSPTGKRLFHEQEVDFQWRPGSSADSGRTNIDKLHAAAAHRNLTPLLEVSPLTKDPVGARISVARLTLKDEASYYSSVLGLYHGSMVFTGGGPFSDLYRASDREIAADPRLKESGRLAGFRFQGLEWGPKAEVMFYDWLVIQAIHRHRKLPAEIDRFLGFTDITCRAGGRGICHARTCALYVGLAAAKLVDKVLKDQDLFIETLVADPFYGS